MSSKSGNILSGLQDAYFVIDTHNIGTGVSPIGCGGYNGSTDGVINQISFNKSLFTNGLRLSGKSYYTGFGISYPEGNYGGDGANRNGVTQGYDVKSGSKFWDAGRAITMLPFNHDINDWVPSVYFRGTGGVGGRCYDNYSGYGSWPEQVRYFSEDFSRISGLFPNCTFVIIGSHASSGFDQTLVNNLISLGAPSNVVNSWVPTTDWKEFVLVGKPGLGSGNAYGWAIENYPTNSTQVGHLNFGLPIKTLGELEFDGTDDYMSFTGITGHQQAFGTIEAWCYPTIISGDRYVFSIGENTVYGASRAIRLSDGYWSYVNYGGGTEDWNGIVAANVNAWSHVVITWQGTYIRFFVNGTEYSATRTGLVTPQGGRMTIGTATWSLGSSLFSGKIGSVKAYTKSLSTTEIQNNYNRTKSQYGL